MLRNVSSRRLILSLDVRVSHEGAASIKFDFRPSRFSLGPGRVIRVRVRARVTSGLEGGAPAEGMLVVTPVAGRELNALMPRFGTVVATQDWHPANHRSFTAQGGEWPPHCVAGTPGAEFHPGLDQGGIDLTVRKATTADDRGSSSLDACVRSLRRSAGAPQFHRGLSVEIRR